MDLGTLYAYDPAPTDEEEFKGDPTELIIANGTKIAQSLIVRPSRNQPDHTHPTRILTLISLK
eukprot:8192990-Pyramimonas_sp.AAC.2